jgi:glycosyltransferase involved in cell wall biosynthesis
VLLDAWPEVLVACPNARLLLFGQGAEEQHLRAQAERAGLGNRVIFAGFRADLLRFLGHADLVAHPALREGLGVSLLEAQAAGLPVVACRAGGIPEAVADGASAWLVPPGNAVALAGALVQLLQNHDRRHAMGEAGRAHVAQNFSIDAMVSGNLAVYRELLEL